MKRRRAVLILLIGVLAGCRASSGPPAEEVKKAAAELFARAARGEAVPEIHFTGDGTVTPRLIASEIRARHRVGEAFEYDVRLTYLNRIRQMEWATVTVRFERQAGKWEVAARGA